MSNQGTSTESSNDDQTKEDSDAEFKQADNAERGKFASFSGTTLQDIPTEILQCILIKAITMEVKNMKLAKSVWKEKADLVISRLESVCSQWSNILTTDFFRLELHRALNGIDQEAIRMEILQESLVKGFVLRVTALKDEILMLCLHRHRNNVSSPLSYSSSIAVYDRSNVEEVKEDIALPLIRKGDMAACNISNCVYVLEINAELQCTSILRIARNEEHKFNIQTWISDLRFPISSGSLSVSDKGNLITISRAESPDPTAVTVYNANGVLQHEVMLSPETYGFIDIESNAIQKTNGNLVLGLVNSQFQMVVTEIDAIGTIHRQYKSSLRRCNYMSSADTSGRILIHDLQDGIELLDSELNVLEFIGPQPKQDVFKLFHCLHFNSDRNEVVRICDAFHYDDGDGDDDDYNNVSLLRIFRFREE